MFIFGLVCYLGADHVDGYSCTYRVLAFDFDFSDVGSFMFGWFASSSSLDSYPFDLKFCIF